MAGLSPPIPRSRKACIGLDLDNTIICYRQSFADAAVLRNFVTAAFRGDKSAVRRAVRALPNGERLWTELQAEVYGTRIMSARVMPGAIEFVRRAAACSIPVVIVSHKSVRPAADPQGVDLREAARGWLEHHGFIAGDTLSADAIFFEATRAEKIARIRSLGCSVFVDDLVEVFEDVAFPSDVTRILIAEDGAPSGDYQVVRSWHEASRILLGRDDHAG